MGEQRLRATARNAAGETVKVVEAVGEPELIKHHLLHVDGVETVDVEVLDGELQGGTDAVG